MLERRTLVEGLAPFSSYVFRMRAINVLGVGEPSLETGGHFIFSVGCLLEVTDGSQTLTAIRENSLICIYIFILASFRTLSDLPDSYPNNIGGGGGVVGLLTITWDVCRASNGFYVCLSH